jgi:predicted Ser/Thr protein kinase
VADDDLPTGSFGELLRDLAAAPPAEPRAPIGAGTVIGDAFEVVRRLGAGGMGTVYLGVDRALGRDVAIKVHSAVQAEDATLREAQVTARVRHTNVVTVYEVGEHEGRVFVAMEFLGGGNLREWLATPRPWRAIVDRFVAAGQGLIAAHAVGVVHRDFKPANVLIEDDRTCVSDFGLARPLVVSDLAVGSGTTGAGTPAYMAPEQHRGEAVGPAADQFAFCVALWEALYGAHPFPGARDVRDRFERGPSPPAARGDVPPRLEAILRRGLAADPPSRWPSMAALLAADLRARRRRWLGIAVAVTVAAAAAAGAAVAMVPSPSVPRGLAAAAAASPPSGIVRAADGGWALHLGGIGHDMLEDAVHDRDGNLYLVGHFSAPFELAGSRFVSPGGTSGAGFVIKLDPSGAVAWRRIFAGPSRTVVVRVIAAGDRAGCCTPSVSPPSSPRPWAGSRQPARDISSRPRRRQRCLSPSIAMRRSRSAPTGDLGRRVRRLRLTRRRAGDARGTRDRCGPSRGRSASIAA